MPCAATPPAGAPQPSSPSLPAAEGGAGFSMRSHCASVYAARCRGVRGRVRVRVKVGARVGVRVRVGVGVGVGVGVRARAKGRARLTCRGIAISTKSARPEMAISSPHASRISMRSTWSGGGLRVELRVQLCGCV